MLIRARYGTAEFPVVYETDNDGEPVYSITITDCNTESVTDLGCLMVLLNNTLKEAHHFHKTLEQQTRMFTRTDTSSILKGELSGYSLEGTGFSIAIGRLMITCPWMIFMRTSMIGIVDSIFHSVFSYALFVYLKC